MERCFVGLDVSKDETAIRVCREDGVVIRAAKVRTDPDAIGEFHREVQHR
ncbi:hypothetical protein [Amaricoccus sp. W119]